MNKSSEFRIQTANRMQAQIFHLEGFEILSDIENMYYDILNGQRLVNLYAKYYSWDGKVQQFLALNPARLHELFFEWLSVKGFFPESLNGLVQNPETTQKTSKQLEELRAIVVAKSKVLKKLQAQSKPKTVKQDNTVQIGKLTFSFLTGDFKLGDIVGSLGKGTQEYIVLTKLLSSDGFMTSYKELLSELHPDYIGFGKAAVMELAHVIKRIKLKMDILPKKEAKNRDIFQVHKADKSYRLVIPS